MSTFSEITSERSMETNKKSFDEFIHKIIQPLELILFKKGYLLMVIGLLLGRAFILSKFSPFALPFFVAVFLLKRQRSPHVLVALLLGALTIHWQEAAIIGIACLLFLVLHRVYKPSSLQQKIICTYVFVSLFLARGVEKYIQTAELGIYDLLMMLVEAGLALALTLIFIQCVPLLSLKKRFIHLKTEEIISFVIMLASILTGTIGWKLFDVAIDHVLSRYLILLFSFIGGASVGTTVGVVSGLIFSLANLSSLYQMSLLAFAGLLGGLLKEGKRVGTAIGLLVATLLVGLYAEGNQNLMITLSESAIAVLLFFLTPHFLISRLAKVIPGTPEHQADQQQYIRNVRDVTAQRVSQFSNIFQALSDSFSQVEATPKEKELNREFDFFLSNVTEKSCQTCFKKKVCWGKEFDQTYQIMGDLMHEIAEDPLNISKETKVEWKKFCVKFDKVTHTIRNELSLYQANLHLKKQVHESRKIVADQLQGVSKVMEDFANEIQKERKNLQLQEEQILETMQKFGINVQQIEIYSLDRGGIDIEISMFEESYGVGEKLIAPMLSDILDEHIILVSEKSDQESFHQFVFRSAKKFVVETGVANAAKGGGLISGDSFSMIEIGRGKHAIAISDGMGNGVRAHAESTETLQLLRKILESGIEEKVAIKSINSILSLRTTDEIFSTLDLAMIDLQDAKVKFLKIGSTPSFIRRGNRVTKIQGNNLPIGIIREFDVDVIHEQLQAGDLLIMMSDGIFEGPKHIENYDIWMSRKIRELQTTDPQEVADLILEEVVRTSSGQIEDDMTVVVAFIKHNIPKWSNISTDYKVQRTAESHG